MRVGGFTIDGRTARLDHNTTGLGRHGAQDRKLGRMNTVRGTNKRNAGVRRALLMETAVGTIQHICEAGAGVSRLAIAVGIGALTISATDAFAEQWTGAVSSDWYDPGNWDTGVPAGTLDVVVDQSVPNPLVLGSGLVHLNGHSIAVGLYGDGVMTISSGAELVVGQATINAEPVSTGLVTVTGAGSTWRTDQMFVGYEGQATLVIENGGVVTSSGATISRVSGTGTVTVDGTGSRWEIGESGASWGHYGNAEITISNGGVVTVGDRVYVGNTTGSSGELTVNGTGSRLEIDEHLVIGNAGSASVEITNGGYISADIVAFGSSTPGNTTSLVLDGSGSELHADGGIQIGFANTQTMSITDGAGLYTGRVEENPFIGRSYVGYLQPRGQSASVLISGTGSVWEDANYILIRDASWSDADTGTITVENGGSLRGFALDVGRGRDIDITNPSDPFWGEAYLIATGAGTTVEFDWLSVGNAGAKGTVDISAGAVVTTGETYLGGGATYGGGNTGDGWAFTALSDVDLILSGAGTLWQTTETGEHSFVVESGETRIHVTDQARLDVAGDMELGGYTDNPTEADVQMTVDAGGTVHTGGKVLLARADGSVVVVTVDGAGSDWTVDGELVVGAAGDGTLQVLDGATVTAGGFSGQGVLVIDGSTVTVGGADTSTTFSGEISGSGDFVKTGIGTLSLTGSNTFTGLTTIDQGTFSLGNGGAGGSLAGDIFNDNAFLVFNRSDDFTYAGILSGAGATSFIGAGTTTLTADSSGLAGPAFITNGNLHLAGGAFFGTNLLTVESGGALSGNGTVVGNLAVAGRLEPGASIGTLTVTGDLTLDSGATYVVELNDAGNVAGVNSDLIVADTAAIQTGATLHVTAENGIDTGETYVPETIYTVIQTSADGNMTVDAAPTITDNFAFLYFTGDTDGLNYYLTSHITDLCLPTATANQCATANAVEEMGAGHLAYDSVLLLGQAEANAAFDAMSGEVHASSQHVIDQTFALFNRTLRYQGIAGIGAGNFGANVASVPAADDADARVRGAWAAPLGAYGRIDGDGNAARLEWWNAGLAGGYEGVIDMGSGNAVGGFGFGYIRSHGSIPDRRSTFDGDGFYLGAYGAWNDGPWTVAGALSYGANSVSTERGIVFGTINETATADYWAHTIGLSGEASYAFDLTDRTKLAPLFTLDAGWSGHGGFTERGAGAFNLTSGSESWTRFDTGIGLALTHTVLTEHGKLMLEGRAVWEHAFADVVPDTMNSFVGGTPFEIRGPAAAADRLRLGAGLSWDISDDMTVRARYDGLFSSDQANHSASLGFNVRF